MKGRNGSTGVETTQGTSVKPEHAERESDRQSFISTQWMFQRLPRKRRVLVAMAGLVIAFLIGVFFIGYGSKLYEHWRERRLLEKATTLLQGGQLTEAAQIAQDLAGRHPDSLAALSILADAAERQNLEEAVA